MPQIQEKWLRILKGFLVGEACLQVINAVTGLLLVRWMSVEQFAQYSMANAFQSGAQQFVEFGLGGALVALVGKDVSDRRRMGRLVAAGCHIRRKTLLIVGSISAIVFPVWFASKGWSLWTGLVLSVAIFAYLVVSGLQTYYRPPLAIHGELRQVYRITLISQLARLAAFALAHVVHTITAPLAIFFNFAATWFTGIQFKSVAHRHLEMPEGSAPAESREILAYIRPIMPGIAFAAIQSQLAVFVAAAFGQTQTIAEVGALGRLAILLGFFSAANGMLIAPFIARQDHARLFPRYCLVAIFAILVAASIFSAAWAFPSLFLAILGFTYADSAPALLPMVAGASIGYLNEVLWTMNSARKWVFWWMPVVSIPGTLAVQVLGIWLFDVSTAAGVFLMILMGSAFVLLTRLNVALWGFWLDAKAAQGRLV